MIKLFWQLFIKDSEGGLPVRKSWGFVLTSYHLSTANFLHNDEEIYLRVVLQQPLNVSGRTSRKALEGHKIVDS